eukprot:gnl/TRDRNA2_/TRDRNA2_37329_c0_seq1.p1 gnl/TRDRNA2_/TRDRNA2_37329_c0~~gnl/TRDRNA2_/TRDRNA2_37329_c0_seq1.p1  ORF type:complete len:244 (+),score=47.46 gnl/TRDRNA2_/TRDRNA2_37329_c0_seq1:1-732(+)
MKSVGCWLKPLKQASKYPVLRPLLNPGAALASRLTHSAMFVPIANMPQSQQPTDFMMKLQPLVCIITGLNFVQLVVSAIIVQDFVDAFCVSIQVVIGVCVVKQNLELTVVIAWGVIGLINAMSAFAWCLDYGLNSGFPLFSPDLSNKHNFRSAFRIVEPCLLLPAVPIAYMIAKDALDNMTRQEENVGFMGAAGWGAGAGSPAQPVSFSGVGQRLGEGGADCSPPTAGGEASKAFTGPSQTIG